MPDVFTKSKRSYVMSRIRSHGNQDTEVALAKFLRHHKITGWRRQQKLIARKLTVEGRKKSPPPRSKKTARNRPYQLSTKNPQLTVRPDFTFLKSRTVVFVDGCFWHGCPRCYRRPKSNRKFWDAKIARNRQRDRQVTRKLRRHGWRVLRIWEHSLRRATRATKNEQPTARLLHRIKIALK